MRGMDKLYTTNEAAGLLEVTPARVRQMVARDEIASVKMGRDRFITAAAIAEARQRKTKPGPTPKSAETQTRATGQAARRNGTSGRKKGGVR
jgi:excisionase family DNA binding protein